MYLLNSTKHDVHINAVELDFIGDENSIMLEIDALRIFSQNILGVLKGDI